MVTEETADSRGSMELTGTRAGAVALFAMLGAASGAVATSLLHGLFAIFQRPSYDITDWLQISPTTLLPGFVFGLIVGFALHRRGTAGLGRAAAYTVAATLSYFAAVTLAVAIQRDIGSMIVTGMIAGLLGAACLTAVGAWLFPFQRRTTPIVLMVAAGCVLGALLVFFGDSWWGPFLLYVPWQAAYAAAFATALPVGGRQSGLG